jgi:hypothetical protein
MRLFKWVALCAAFMLCSCRSNPTFDTFTTLLPWSKQYAQIQPGFEYLWVSLDGRASVMALGERTIDKSSSSGRVHEYWYTGQGEMLHLVDGRIQQALGFTRELRGQASTAAPQWNEVLQTTREFNWRRQIDLMPGYRYNLVNYVVTYPSNAPQKLPEGVSTSVRWVTDLVESKARDGQAWWYLQKFALLDNRVVYSEQCIDKDVCLQMRPLGVVVPAK